MSETFFFNKIKPLFTYAYIERLFDTGVSMRTYEIWNEHVLNELSNRDVMKNSLFKSTLKVLDRIAPSDDYNKIFRYVFFK